MAPEPATARPIEVNAPTHTLTWSISIRVCCLNWRSIIAAGDATAPLMITVRPSSWTTGVALGSPIAAENGPASTYVRPAMTKLAPSAIVVTVGAMSLGSSRQRTIAKLTPSSLKLSTAISAIRATA